MASLEIQSYSYEDSLEKQKSVLTYNLNVSMVDRIPMGSHGIYTEEKHYLELLIRVIRKKIDRDHC